jgi:hypothetical protein
LFWRIVNWRYFGIIGWGKEGILTLLYISIIEILIITGPWSRKLSLL